uniref:Uncharacterized protein n=1 Tax=viral metagenome TaxID=1070528 RepID=A0A6M3LQD7_9ZZZZ
MSKIQEAIKFLKELEWGQVTGSHHTCRWCGRYKVDGHANYCKFSMALVLLEVEPDEPPKTCYHIADEIVVLVNMLTDKISNQAGEFLRNQAEIERLKAELEAAKEGYDQLHIDFCNRGAELRTIDKQRNSIDWTRLEEWESYLRNSECRGRDMQEMFALSLYAVQKLRAFHRDNISDQILLESQPEEATFLRRLFHRCGDRIRPYPGVLCSKGDHGPEDDFDSITEISRLTAELAAKDKAISLLNSMVESGESHTEKSRAVLNQARGGGE